jgi:hypothetical protein
MEFVLLAQGFSGKVVRSETWFLLAERSGLHLLLLVALFS